MSNILWAYALFAAKTLTLVLAIGVLMAWFAGLLGRSRAPEGDRLRIRRLNRRFFALTRAMNREIMPQAAFKPWYKAQQAAEKARLKETESQRKRIYVLEFKGDVRASAVAALREEITAVLTVATPADEVVVKLESPGGMVHAYGLAASQLARLGERQIPLTIIVDKVAASGGYMMACVGDTIIAAPFAVIGSIGVVAQLPNFHKLLKKHDIDYEQLTAGEFKRTLTVFGENTDKARDKFQQELDETHELFKEFVTLHRPSLQIDKVATGEFWYGQRAIELGLVDQLSTSDDYLMRASQSYDMFEIHFIAKREFSKRLQGLIQGALDQIAHGNFWRG